MSDDPIKLFVVVMAILLCVLGFVAYLSFQQASAFEQAVADAAHDATLLRENAGAVQSLCTQIGKGGGGGSYKTMIDNAAKYNGIRQSRITTMSPKRIGKRGTEKRFKIEIGRGGGGAPLTREQIAKFCRTVEGDSRNILKTIEITMRRATGKGGAGKAGTSDEVINDTYIVTIVFGLRVVS